MSRRRPPRAVVLVLTCAGDLAPKGELNRVVIGEAKYLPNHRLKLLLARGPRLHGDLVGLAVVDDRHDGIGLGQAGVRLLPVGQRGVAEAALVLLPAGERVGGQAGGERVGRLLARASRLLLLHPRKITGGASGAFVLCPPRHQSSPLARLLQLPPGQARAVAHHHGAGARREERGLLAVAVVANEAHVLVAVGAVLLAPGAAHCHDRFAHGVFRSGEWACTAERSQVQGAAAGVVKHANSAS